MLDKKQNISDSDRDELQDLTALQQRLYSRLQAQLVSNETIVRVMGKAGSGKSQLAVRLFHENDTLEIVHIPQPNLSRRAFLISACTQLKIEWESGDHQSGTLFDKLKHRIASIKPQERPLLLVIDEAEQMGLPVLTLLLSLLEYGTAVGRPLRLLMLGRPELNQLMRLPGYDELLQSPIENFSLDTFSLTDYAAAVIYWLSFPKFRTWFAQWLKEHHLPSIKRKSALNGLLLLIIMGGVWSADETKPQTRDWRIVANWEQPPLHLNELAPPSEQAMQASVLPMDDAFEERVLAGGSNAAESYRKLFSLWGIKGVKSPQESPCRRVVQYNLRCLKGAGSWSYLTQTGHPALLVLWTDLGDPTPRFALLYGMRDGDPLLDYGEGPTVVAKGVVEKYWRGDYLLFWHPTGPVVTMGPGSIGDGVVWMRSRLESWDGVPNNFSEIYDVALSQRLKDFQRAHQLKADGLAGEKTMVVLNRYSSDQDEQQNPLMLKLVSRFDSSGRVEGDSSTTH